MIHCFSPAGIDSRRKYMYDSVWERERTMQRYLKLAGIFAGVVISAMLWFWLPFGNYRVICDGVVQSLFLAGSTWFGGLAVLWGVIVLLVAAGVGPRWLRAAGLALVCGSFYHTFHQGALSLWPGVDVSISALAAIGLTQPLLIHYMRPLPETAGRRRRALSAWLILTAGGAIGVLGTQLLLLTVPCELTIEHVDFLTRAVQWSALWYLIWGILPALITAIICAQKTHPSRV